MKVAIIYGRFQPLSRAHWEMIDKAIKKYKEVFVLPVQGEKAFKSDRKTEKGIKSDLANKLDRNPLPAGIRQKLILQAFPTLDDKHVFRSLRGNILDVYEQIKRMYPSKKLDELVVICGADEYEEYVRQIQYVVEKYPDVKVDIEKYDSGTRSMVDGKLETSISGTALRKTLVSKSGYPQFVRMIAPPLANRETYKYLQKVLLKVQKKELEEQIFRMFNI